VYYRFQTNNIIEEMLCGETGFQLVKGGNLYFIVRIASD